MSSLSSFCFALLLMRFVWVHSVACNVVCRHARCQCAIDIIWRLHLERAVSNSRWHIFRVSRRLLAVHFSRHATHRLDHWLRCFLFGVFKRPMVWANRIFNKWFAHVLRVFPKRNSLLDRQRSSSRPLVVAEQPHCFHVHSASLFPAPHPLRRQSSSRLFSHLFRMGISCVYP